MKKYVVSIAVTAMVVVAALTVFGMSNQTTAIENSISHSASSFKEMTTETYLSNYNKRKEELAVKGIHTLPFQLELEKKTNFYRFYYPKQENTANEKAIWVSVMLSGDQKTINGIMYEGVPDVHTVKAMIQATGLTWTPELDQFIAVTNVAKTPKEMVVSDVKVTIEGTSEQIKVMVDPVKLEAPKKL
ncbi:hypothetical protein [Brevibacillus brevis]|uniref:hypothetical protein n=1 Tax=Brevibacillus brevis TaxID=1393 RepID=UPI000D10EFF6|nr:hypothetical protein [Brevibacillus brevis]PSJ69216.1 hypothetical protein C7J99_10975 [Brevibacillus brevis]RED27493.1 hypothetical protein DES34_110185 [Brevibacillus brevis]GEC90843.1 hypothetical protein BBR01nite_31740 [Brevibacillus brevis]VEF91346.1 Uncharacterised protein [Brevibacillus brevis]